jgi:post-segregation antitoxin (ccd killing protein)
MSVADIVLSDDLASRVRSAARARGVTVEALITQGVDALLAAERQLAYLEARAARSDVGAAIELVRKAPDVQPEAGDEMPDEGPADRH